MSPRASTGSSRGLCVCIFQYPSPEQFWPMWSYNQNLTVLPHVGTWLTALQKECRQRTYCDCLSSSEGQQLANIPTALSVPWPGPRYPEELIPRACNITSPQLPAGTPSSHSPEKWKRREEDTWQVSCKHPGPVCLSVSLPPRHGKLLVDK